MLVNQKVSPQVRAYLLKKRARLKNSSTRIPVIPERSRIPFRIYPTEHKCRPIFIQQIDDCVIDYVLNNRKLQKISRCYPIVFAYSGLKHKAEINKLYSNATILEAKENCVFEKAKLTFDYLKKLDDYDVVIRTCPDAVIMDVDWLLTIADEEFLFKYDLMGNCRSAGRSEKTWLRGGCLFISKNLISKLNLNINNIDHDLLRKQNHDLFLYNEVLNGKFKVKKFNLFEYSTAYKGLYAAWHPHKEEFKSEEKFPASKYYSKLRRIALLVPSRERFENKKRLVESIKKTVYDIDNITLYFGIDSDDSTVESVYALQKENPFLKILIIPSSGKFQNLGILWNKCAEVATEDIFSMIGDDMVFKTKNWDLHILKEFDCTEPDGFKFVYCNDGNVGHKPVNSFINRGYYDILGYYCREEFPVDGIDTWLYDVYRRLGRTVYLSEVVIEHLHWHFNKAEKDSVVDRMNHTEASKISKDLYKKLKPCRDIEIEILKPHLE